jgi:hypothetical protein
MAISLVQTPQQSSATGTSTTLALAFGSSLTAGSYLYVAACQVDTNAITMACADSKANSFTQLGSLLVVGGGTMTHFATTAPCAAGADTVTITYSPTATFRAIFIAEIGGSAGLDTSGTYHSEHLNTSGTAMTSGTLTPSVANGLAIGAFLDGNLSSNTTVPTSGAGFTDLFPTANTFWNFSQGHSCGDAAYQIYTTTANVPILFTISAFENIGGCIGALFAPTGSPPPAQPGPMARQIYVMP